MITIARQIIETKCPVCGEANKIRFAFIEHYDVAMDVEAEITRVNPSDTYDLLMCPNNHIFDLEGTRWIQTLAFDKLKKEAA